MLPASANPANAAAAESPEGGTSTASGTEPASPEASEATGAGLNVNSPEYRHFQSVKDKEVAAAKAAAASEVEVLRMQMAELQRRQMAAESRATSPESSENQNGAGLKWADAPRFKAPDGSYFDEDTAKSIDDYVERKIQWTIEQLQQQQVHAEAQTQMQKAEQTLIGFAQSLDPGQQAGLVGLVKEYESIARDKPEAFIAFAKVQLGIGNPAPSAPEPAPQKPAAERPQAIPASVRPTQNRGGGLRKADKEASIRDRVSAIVRQHNSGQPR